MARILLFSFALEVGVILSACQDNQIQIDLTIAALGTGNGNVMITFDPQSAAPATETCEVSAGQAGFGCVQGWVVDPGAGAFTLQASPLTAGDQFVAWGGECAGRLPTESCTFSYDTDISVNFFAVVQFDPTGVTQVVVTPAVDTVTTLGASGGKEFTAQALDASGQPLPGTIFSWATGDPAIATVEASPLGASANVTGVAAGQTVVTATSGNALGFATVVVAPSSSVQVQR